MLNFKNNFLWEFMRRAKTENPVEKFDQNFWGKVDRSIKGGKKMFADKAHENLKPEYGNSAEVRLV